MSRGNFEEFIIFFQKVYTPLKFIEDSNIESVARFLT
jgi:hypothetical protein